MKEIIATAAIVVFTGLGVGGCFAQQPPLEDEAGWSCVDDGNRVCGPHNEEGQPPGCYDDGGVLFASWPCEAWKPENGYKHP